MVAALSIEPTLQSILQEPGAHASDELPRVDGFCQVRVGPLLNSCFDGLRLTAQP